MSMSFLNKVKELNVPFTLQIGEEVFFKDNNAYNTFNDCIMYDSSFNIPSNTVNCYGMFYNCPNLNHKIHIDPYGAVNDMRYMFYNCNNYGYDINIPISCNQWYGMLNYCTYNGDIHVYTNESSYGQGNFAYSFYGMDNFNGNIIFHDVEPTNMYYAFAFDYRFNRNVLIPDTVQNVSYCFDYCQNLNHNIKIPESAQNCSRMFYGCYNLNQNIRIPNNVDASGMFSSCLNLDQMIKIPSNSNISNMFSSCVNLDKPFTVPYYDTNYYTDYVYGVNWDDTAEMQSNGQYLFYGCSNFDAPIDFDDGIESLRNTFTGCINFNQYVTIPSHLKFARGTFASCYMSFNQNIVFPEGTLEMVDTFVSCSRLNQNIKIPSTVKTLKGCFDGCSPLNYGIEIPNGCLNTAYMFRGCGNLNQTIVIPNTVTNVSGMFESCYNYITPTVIPEGIKNCYGIFNDCRNYYVSEAVIPSTVGGDGAYERAFYNTRVINVNVLTPNTYSSMVISLASAVDTTGLTMSSVHNADEIPDTQAAWESFDFGTPFGYYKLPNSAINEYYWTWGQGRYLVGDLGYANYDAYLSMKEYYEREYPEYWHLYNHGGLFHKVITDGSYRNEVIYYLDYPNASNEQSVNWYFYNMIHY